MQTTEEILDFAIANEDKARAFYLELADRAELKAMRETLLGFAREEEGHKARLLAIKDGRMKARPATGAVPDLKIADYLVEVVPTPDMSIQDALIVAMQQEKAAIRLYSDLAESTDDADVAATFRQLAEEEARHKLRFETAYDEGVLLEG